jgi:hypothetical protein
MGGADRTGVSPSTSAASYSSSRSSRGSHSPQVGDLLLDAKENVVATWGLTGRRDLVEFNRSAQATVLVGTGKGKIGRECIFHFGLSISNH